MSPNRYGEPEPEVSDEWPEIDAPHKCDKGWVDRMADRMVPCPICKPKLARGERVHLH